MLRRVAQMYSQSCVMIIKHNNNGGVDFVGTGFICHSKGYLLTCAHTISLTDKLGFIPSQPIENFNPLTYKEVVVIDLTVAQYNAENDVALLKITSTEVGVPPNIFGNEEQVVVGASVGYLGFPFAQVGLHALKLSSSIVSAKIIATNGTKQFQLDAMVHEGNSGGPLIDITTGRVIGIISGRFSPTGNGGAVKIGNYALGTESTISYATSISYALDLFRSEGLSW